MQGIVEQVSISRGGVPKRAVAEAVATAQGLTGDLCAHPKYHGGPKQALLLVCAEAIEDLKTQGFQLYPGALGENLTVRGLDHRKLRIGQRWRVGSEARIELTKVRVPCRTLDVYGAGEIQKAVYDKQVKAGDTTSPLWAKAGIYASVVTGGVIRAGDAIVLDSEAA